MDAPANGNTQAAATDAGSTPEANGNQQQLSPKESRLKEIISGRTPIQLYLEFLFSHNHAGGQRRTGSCLSVQVSMYEGGVEAWNPSMLACMSMYSSC